MLFLEAEKSAREVLVIGALRMVPACMALSWWDPTRARSCPDTSS